MAVNSGEYDVNDVFLKVIYNLQKRLGYEQAKLVINQIGYDNLKYISEHCCRKEEEQ